MHKLFLYLHKKQEKYIKVKYALKMCKRNGIKIKPPKLSQHDKHG